MDGMGKNLTVGNRQSFPLQWDPSAIMVLEWAFAYTPNRTGVMWRTLGYK